MRAPSTPCTAPQTSQEPRSASPFLIAERSAWTYRSPLGAYAAIRDHVAVYAEPMDEIRVDGQRVIPQPGNFYGGWVTPNISGPVKGAPRTTHW